MHCIEPSYARQSPNELGFCSRLTEAFTFFQPEGIRGIARHTPVTTRRQTHATHLRTVWHTAAFELLGEETAAEHSQPFLDRRLVVEGTTTFYRRGRTEGFLCQHEDLRRREAIAHEVVD